ncbi:MAG: hypothetical protein IT385_08885 [Deltaproteobacteria bacterium]|nr:hypothetical protein [Deltaproteobacteria bacterium]
MIAPLPVMPGLEIPSEFLSVSYTRSLVRIGDDGEREVMDGVEAARRLPSAVELRCDVRACTTLDEAQKEKVLSHRALRADRRGVVRTQCSDYESRPKNLGGAREAMSYAIREALEAPASEPAAEKKKRGHAGLWKPGGVPARPPAPEKKVRRSRKKAEPPTEP